MSIVFFIVVAWLLLKWLNKNAVAIIAGLAILWLLLFILKYVWIFTTISIILIVILFIGSHVDDNNEFHWKREKKSLHEEVEEMQYKDTHKTTK